MIRRIARLLGLLAVTLCVSDPNIARAQVLTVGAHLGYNINDELPVFGGQLRAGLGYVPPFIVAVNPSIETYLIEGETQLQFDANLLGLIGTDYVQTFQPYVGAGVAVNYFDDEFGQDTIFGLNLIGGASFGIGSAIQPFAYSMGSEAFGEYVTLMGGVLISLGGF